MDHRIAVTILASCFVAAASAARSECAPVYVIPGKPGVPVVINNHEARWMVVEGDCGLGRPGHTAQTVIGGRFVGPLRGEIRPTRYFPTTGQKPAQGRDEREQPSDQPPADINFSRSWSSSSSEPVPPADLPNPVAGEGMPNMPPVIVAPRIGPRRP